jgi:condensin complex subunit 2
VYQGTDEYTFQDPDGPDVDRRFEKITDLLSLGMGFSSKTNAWAGPEHWKYRKAKGKSVQLVLFSFVVPFQTGLLNVGVYLHLDLETARTSSGDLDVAKKTKKKRGKEEPDIDFTNALEYEMENVFAPPKNPKSLLLPANKGSCNNKLPVDCHYQPESLVKLFLLPDDLVILTFHEKYS